MGVSESFLVRLEPQELADIDRVRGLVPRTTWLKSLARDAVLAHDALAGGVVHVLEQPQTIELPKPIPAKRTRPSKKSRDAAAKVPAPAPASEVAEDPELAARIAIALTHKPGCGCLNCDAARAAAR